ncbi:MAG: hypothetical protein NC906_08900 [Candidatus Omnitrophica bacterium]|nr:hypothetical protein [Candidatus Omnitrophota bacterium]
MKNFSKRLPIGKKQKYNKSGYWINKVNFLGLLKSSATSGEERHTILLVEFRRTMKSRGFSTKDYGF